MSDEKNNEQMHQEFHAQTKRQQPKETQSEEVLTVCGIILMIIAVLGGLVMWFAYDFNFFIALAYAFGGFVFGLTIYVIAKICKVLVEIRDKE